MIDQRDAAGTTAASLDRAPAHGAQYAMPVLRRLGAAAELTRTRSMIGSMDGGNGNGNMSRTG